MTATMENTTTITSPATIFGERGRRRIRVLWKIGSGVGPAAGGMASVVLSIVICSGHLARSRIDQHVDHVGQEVGGQHQQGDDHEDALHQGVVELSERVEQV